MLSFRRLFVSASVEVSGQLRKRLALFTSSSGPPRGALSSFASRDQRFRKPSDVIGDWKEDYYHHRRRHSALAYQAPAVYAATRTHQ